MWIRRRWMKISWTEYRSNQEVLDMADENTSLKHHPTKTEKLVRSCVEKWIPSVYSLRGQNGRNKNSWETECYDDMKSNDVEYDHTRKRAYDREDWCHWRPGPAWKDRALKREPTAVLTKRICVCWFYDGIAYTIVVAWFRLYFCLHLCLCRSFVCAAYCLTAFICKKKDGRQNQLIQSLELCNASQRLSVSEVAASCNINDCRQERTEIVAY